MRKLIASVLKRQAKRYLRKNKPKVVVITGSVGKTSTTQAIATVLDQAFVVRKTIKNYNTDLGVPCSIFGHHFPESLKNPIAWLSIMFQNQLRLMRKDDVQVLVLELGTDAPGEIEQFAWLQPDIAVVTAVVPEHMEYFKTLDAVAREELAVAAYSAKTFVNKTMVDQTYLRHAKTEELYNYSDHDLNVLGVHEGNVQVIGVHSLDALAAGAAVGRELGMQNSDITQGVQAVKPQPGRMQQLDGIKGTVLIDDTYNSSPEAAIAALNYLYSLENVQRIALLGNMNELGQVSERMHARVGRYCDPNKLDLVVTLGPDANMYTAPKAQERGCLVAATKTPYDAADMIKKQLREGAVILLKGSQNGVFAEEAVKQLLAHPKDVKYLVRQSQFWIKKKQQNFKAES